MSKIKTQMAVATVIALLGALALLSPLTIRLNAQGAFGAIVGTVTDTTGAAVPGTAVTLTNLGTNEKNTAQTDSAGNYRFMSLPPTSYKVEFEKKDYKRVIQSPVVVLVDATARADASLAIGAATETVEVTSVAPMLQTESGTLGSQVEGKTVQEMPLNGRNAMNLIALVPGVVPQGSTAGSVGNNSNTGRSSSGGWTNYQIGGAIAGLGAMFVDGSPINMLGGNIAGYIPTQDAVQEFKVATNSVSAEFGRFAGGVVEMTTKAGANAWHASTYEYFRNNKLNANDYFSNIQKRARPEWNQNQFGATSSGPILKDKAFYSFVWEGFHSRIGQLQTTNVPTDNMKKGIIPGALTTLNSAITLNGNAPSSCFSYDGTNTTIASKCFDATAAYLKDLWAPATNTNTPGSGAYNYYKTVVTGSDSNQYNGRVDYTLNSKQRLFARYMYMKLADKATDIMSHYGGFLSGSPKTSYATHHAVLGDTITLNGSTIVDLRLSYLRSYIFNVPQNLGVDLTPFGSNYAAIASKVTYKVNPHPSVGGSYSLWAFGPMTNTAYDWYNSYAFNPSLIKIVGNHTLKIGGEVRMLDHSSAPSVGGGSGFFSFDSSGYSKNAWANFLLGVPYQSYINTVNLTAGFNWYQGYYITDTWTASRKLTINAGLRYELPGAVAERKNRAVVNLPDVTDPYTGAHGTLALVNSPLWTSRYMMPSLHKLFSPRIGFAYRVNPNTVVRGGYALMYAPPDMGGVMPSVANINQAKTTVNNNDTATNTRLYNPFPTGFNQPVGASNPKFMTNWAYQPSLQSISGPVPKNTIPYAQQWNISFGRQLKGDTSVELGYAGSTGTHLVVGAGNSTNFGIDQLSSQYASAIATDKAAGMTDAALSSKYRSYTPHPAYLNMIDTSGYYGSMNYHALLAKYQKRFSSGGLITTSYTWSKTIGNTDTTNINLDAGNVGTVQNFNNLRNERSLLSYNIAHRLITSYILDMPFGKGRKFAKNVNGITNALIGGWAVNGIVTYQSGQPIMLTVGDGNVMTKYFGAGVLRPNYTPGNSGCYSNKQVGGSAQMRLNRWFNTSCFTSPGTGLGTESRVDSKIKGQGMANWDMTVVKSAKVKERVDMQFRMEFFNVFNRRQFALPTINYSSSSFGVVTSQGNRPRQIQASLRFAF